MSDSIHRKMAKAYKELGHETRKMTFHYETISHMHEQIAIKEEQKNQEEGR